MTRLTAVPSITGVVAVLSVGATFAAELLPGRLSYLAAILPCGLLFAMWPWLILPVGIVGGVIVSKLMGETDVAAVVLIHVVLLAAGVGALLVRHVFTTTVDERRPTPADGPMVLFSAVAVAGACYGLARGNSPDLVLVALYQVAVIPVYFFLTTHTLTTRRRIRLACIAYASAAAALAAIELTIPGRHGGLLSVLAIPPLFVAASSIHGWRRAGLLLLGALFVTDVVVAGYRSMWLVLGVAVLILLIRGAIHLRRSVTVGMVAGALFLIIGSALNTGLSERFAALGERIDDGTGYRVPEMMVGLHVFADQPLIGGGIGQTTQDIYLPGYMTTDVGPVYHVFWVIILANLGVIGLLALLWPLWRSLRVGVTSRDGYVVAMLGLTCGFLIAACFSGPTDGHWELGLLPALTILLAMPRRDSAEPETARLLSTGQHMQSGHRTDRGPIATAIVVTYNSRAHIVRCLSALDQPGMLVRLVDNASTDGTRSLVATTFPHISVESNPANVGFAAAVNQALRSVHTDVVLLVNPDCELPAATAHALVHVLRTQPDVGVVGPRLVGADGTVAVSAHPFESVASLLASRFGGNVIPVRLRRWLCGGKRRINYDACQRYSDPEPVEVDWLSGACLALRTDLLKELGGLDERYFMYYEDEDVCMRARQHGVRVLYLPGVQATHVGGASCRDPSWLWPHLYHSMLHYFFQHRRGSYPAARVIVWFRAVLGVLLAVVRLPWRRGTAGAQARAWLRVAHIARTTSFGQ